MNIRRKLGMLVCLAGISLSASAQVNEFEEAYKAFRQQALKEYSDFRDKVNKEYADFMRQAWERHQALPEIPKPKDEPPVPPTPYPIDDQTKPIKDSNISQPEPFVSFSFSTSQFYCKHNNYKYNKTPFINKLPNIKNYPLINTQIE